MQKHHTLEDTVYFWFAANTTAGTAGDGASPTFAVRKAGAASSDAPTLTGTPTLLSHANYSDGSHEIAIAATAANGFEANAEYGVFCSLTISSVNPNGFVGSFSLKPIIANATQISGDSTAADNAEAFFDGTGYAGTNNVIPTVTAVSGAVGSVTGAVGSVTGNVGGNVNGNVAGSVGSVTGNVGGNVSGSVGSVAGAVGSVTGSVGSVVGSVGGSVVGSTASVTGAVGSVTGNVGGDVAGKILGGGAGSISGDGVRAASVTGAVGSVTGSVGSVVGSVTVGTNSDKTGYSLSSAGIQAIWDALTSALTAVGSIGKLIVDKITGLTFTVANKVDATADVDEAAIATAVAAELEGGSVTIVTTGPVLTDGNPLTIVQGDDYAELPDDRRITVTLTGTGYGALDGDAWSLRLNTRGTTPVSSTGEATTVDANTLRVKFPLTAAESTTLKATEGEWSVRRTPESTLIAFDVIRGPLIVSRDLSVQRT